MISSKDVFFLFFFLFFDSAHLKGPRGTGNFLMLLAKKLLLREIWLKRYNSDVIIFPRQIPSQTNYKLSLGHFKNQACVAVMILHGYPYWLNEGLFNSSLERINVGFYIYVFCVTRPDFVLISTFFKLYFMMIIWGSNNIILTSWWLYLIKIFCKIFVAIT